MNMSECLSQDIIIKDCNFILRDAPANWLLLQNSRIFLTGGTGFFGKWFLHSFIYINETLHLDSMMTVLSRSPEKFLKENPCFSNKNCIKFVQGDVRDFTIKTGDHDYLIHAATPVSVTENDNETYSIIVDGTKHILNFAKQAGVKKIMLTSSGAVYGNQPPDLSHVPETYQPHPSTAYGKGKLAAERLCLECPVDASIARCFAFVGPYLPLDIHYAIGNFILNAINGNTITINGDGRPYRSYLYAADLMCWLWTILLNGKADEDYNVGSEDAISISELATTVSECCPPAVKCEVLGKPDFNIPAPRYIPNTEKARKELGLKQSYSLTDSIKRTIQWAHRSSIL